MKVKRQERQLTNHMDLMKGRLIMRESDISTNPITDHHGIHHGEHHGTVVPDVQSSNDNSRISESTHEGNEHDLNKEENQSKERKTTMKNRTAPTLTGLALAMTLILGLTTINGVQATNINAGISKAEIQAKIVQPDVIEGAIQEGISLNIINDSTPTVFIKADIRTSILDVIVTDIA
jgi:hypothetical protein